MEILHRLAIVCPRKRQLRVLHTQQVERLERSDAKVSRAVLRGPGASNGPWLPDQL
jgi:hypothetical protein